MVNHHGKDLPHDALLVNKVCRRSIIRLCLLVVQVGDDMKPGCGLETSCHLAVGNEVRILLRHSHDRYVAPGEFIGQLLQLNQLLAAKRSPVRPVCRDKNVFLADQILKIESRTVSFG